MQARPVCHKRAYDRERSSQAENVDFLLICDVFNQTWNVVPMSKPIYILWQQVLALITYILKLVMLILLLVNRDLWPLNGIGL